MNKAAACAFLRHHTKVRHLGDLVGIWCDQCGFVALGPEAPAIESAPTRDPVPPAFLEGWAPGELVEAFGK